MGQLTRQDIIKLVKEEDVEFIRLQFTDIFGNFKNMAVTTSQLDKILDGQCMFDGASLYGFPEPEEGDLFLSPDLDTFVTFPWRPQQGKVARFLCDVHRADGTPFEGDPRYILKKVIKEAEAMGLKFYVGPECEFFLFNTQENGNPTTDTDEMGGYFDIGPIDSGENARREIVLTLEEMGFEIEASHHEVAPAQHEIDIKYDSALQTADNLMTFKLAVRTVAKRHGLHATFMPKPNNAVNGSGMHINMSLSKNGKNLFEDPKEEQGLSKDAYFFIGGLIKHIRPLTAITNPLVNSYKRLVPGFEAPVYIAWSAVNRSQLIRIPSTRGSHTRIELRCPDPASNPYLALAACLAAGLDGIKNQLLPLAAVDKNPVKLSRKEREELGIRQLPVSLAEAIEELEHSDFLQDVLGKQICSRYIEAKRAEWQEYSAQVTSWERKQYLNRI